MKETHISSFENDFIPLLISSPLPLSPFENEDSLLSQLRELGIIVERLDSSTLVLRSFYKLYFDFNLEYFISLFLEHKGDLTFLEKTPFMLSSKWLLQIKEKISLRKDSLIALHKEKLNSLFSHEN